MSPGARRILAVTTGLALVTAAAAAAPGQLRRIPAFAVTRVAVIDARHLAPRDVIAASGIGSGASVFDDPAPWIENLAKHPLIAAVQVERQLPGTLVFRITENEPVAMASVPELRPVDARGRILPIREGAMLDLPVVLTSGGTRAGRIDDSSAVAVVGTLARIQRLEPALADRISEVQPEAGGALRARLRDPLGAELLIPARPTGPELHELRLVLADLLARDEAGGVARLDARFAGQIVVSFIANAQ